MTDSTVWVALFLSLFAGLSTCIGGAVVFFSNLKNTRFLALSMSFAAGVMIYVSFMEMLPEAQLVLGDLYGNYSGGSIMVGLFFLGMLLVYCIEKLFPSLSEIKDTETDKLPNKSRLYRTGVLVAIFDCCKPSLIDAMHQSVVFNTKLWPGSSKLLIFSLPNNMF